MHHYYGPNMEKSGPFNNSGVENILTSTLMWPRLWYITCQDTYP